MPSSEQPAWWRWCVASRVAGRQGATPIGKCRAERLVAGTFGTKPAEPVSRPGKQANQMANCQTPRHPATYFAACQGPWHEAAPDGNTPRRVATCRNDVTASHATGKSPGQRQGGRQEPAATATASRQANGKLPRLWQDATATGRCLGKLPREPQVIRGNGKTPWTWQIAMTTARRLGNGNSPRQPQQWQIATASARRHGKRKTRRRVATGAAGTRGRGKGKSP